MKEQPEVIKRFRSLTQQTLKKLTHELTGQCSLASAKCCTSKLDEQMNFLEAFVFGMINQLGNQYLKAIQGWTASSCAMLAAKTESEDLQSKLDYSYSIVAEKNIKIENLTSSNTILTHKVVQLQQLVAIQASQLNGEENQTLDSMEDQNSENLSLYQSEAESESEELAAEEDFGNVI